MPAFQRLTPPPMLLTRRSRATKLLVFGVIAFVVGNILFARFNTPKAAAFQGAASLQAALASAADSPKPVLAFVTADWCPPCQQLKRGPLSDPGVTRWIHDNTHPAYIDADAHPADAQALYVTQLPTLLFLRQGKETARLTGFVPTKELLVWLAQHSGPRADRDAAPSSP